VNKDDMSDDAEFDAFLKGEGELSRRLQAMPQGEPSAELDNAILNRARLAMAQEAHPQAANDPGEQTGAPRLARPFGYRWRVPVGIAATLLAGVFGTQAFQKQQQEPTVAEMVDAPAALIAPAAQDNVVMQDMQVPAAPPVAERAPAKELRRAAPAPAPVVSEPVAAGKADIAAAAAPPPPPPPMMEFKAAPAEAPAAAAPAPVAAAAPQRAEAMAGLVADADKRKAVARSAREETLQRVEVTGSRNKLRDSKVWLADIEQLLKDGNNEEALHEWQGFRVAYPRVKVAPELEARLDALDK
jgi:hypothetical protein